MAANTNWLPSDLCNRCAISIRCRISNVSVEPSDASEREIAAEFLSNWLFFICEDSCDECFIAIDRHIQGLRPGPSLKSMVIAPPSVHKSLEPSDASNGGLHGAAERIKRKRKLSVEQEELDTYKNVRRNKEFVSLERVRGASTNIVAGLELHSGVFSLTEQKKIVEFVYHLQNKGHKGEFGERTYSAPAKWMRGKGRVTMQFGCNYNYAPDRHGNPPGIMRDVAPEPMPDLFKFMIKRLIKWSVLPTSCIPDSCIVNIYEPGDCIPPHIDSHDFLRPFCTVSFVSECSILFGTSLKVLGPGEFAGSLSIPLPVGSVLVLNGNGADVAKHCVPAVPSKRISITFRKMKRAKWPVGFALEPDLQKVVPLIDSDSAADGKGRRSAEGSGDTGRKRHKNIVEGDKGEGSVFGLMKA